MGADDLSAAMAEVCGLTSTPSASTTVLAAAKKSVRGYRCTDKHLHRVDVLSNVRTIELTASDILGALHEGNLDRAILVAATAKILGRSVSDGALYNELKEAVVKELHELCDVLTAEDGAMLLSLDDFTDLFDDHSERAKGLYYGHPPNAKDVMDTMHATLEETMRKPGVAIVLSGRTPSVVYDEWVARAYYAYHSDGVLDALSKKDLINILCKTQRGDRFLRDKLNLTTDRDVHDLACCLLRYTGGHGRVVECALKALEQDGTLQQRPSGQGVPDVLSDDYMANLFNEHIKPLNIFPRGTDVPAMWNKKKTMSSLLSVMHEARFQGDGLVSEEKWVQVLANASERDHSVRAKELLSVMGVPFTIIPWVSRSSKEPYQRDKLQVHASLWLLQSLKDETQWMSPKAIKMLDALIKGKDSEAI